MISGDEFGRREPFPDGPGGAEPIGTLGMVEDEIWNHDPIAYHAGIGETTRWEVLVKFESLG